MQFKKKITKYLIASAILLLIINVALDFFIKRKKDVNIEHEFSCQQLDSIFYDVLNDFGIESEWISSVKIKIPDEDSIEKKIIVKLPADLPIPLIIRDFHKKIENDITSFVSEEKKFFGTTEIRIYSNEYLKQLIQLIPDKQIVRNRNELCFIISDAFELSEKDFNSFLSIPYPFSTVVIPDEDIILKANELKNYSKEFIVLLNDDVVDMPFKLNPKSHKYILKNSVKNIALSFSNAQLFVVDETSELYNSTTFNFIKDEFKKRKINLINLSEFIHLNSDDENELISKFRFYAEDKSESDKNKLPNQSGLPNQKIFYLTYENFLKIKNEFDRMRKKGNKIIPLSATYLVKNNLK